MRWSESLLGPQLLQACDISVIDPSFPALEQPLDHEILPILEAALRAEDPTAVPFAAMAPFSTDAKHTIDWASRPTAFRPSGPVPVSHSSTASMATTRGYPLEALRFGLPVLCRVINDYGLTARPCREPARTT